MNYVGSNMFRKAIRNDLINAHATVETTVDTV